MRWIFWVTFVVGLWLIAAPFGLAYSEIVQATVNDIGLGVLIAGASLWIALRANAPGWLGWALMACGVWAVIAPFALGYSSTASAMTNDVAAGVVVIVAAIARELFAGRRRILHA